jgi:hypothetical protein
MSPKCGEAIRSDRTVTSERQVVSKREPVQEERATAQHESRQPTGARPVDYLRSMVVLRDHRHRHEAPSGIRQRNRERRASRSNTPWGNGALGHADAVVQA